MGMNRYDNGSVSAYTPQTMQELAFVPMMQREKHDKLIAEQEAIRAGLAKVNPLDVHYNKALQLKKDIESQLDATSNELAQHGVSNDMTGKVITLNRKYNDLVSPTGEIGRINTAKEVRDKTREEHIKAALASHQSYADAIRNWDVYEKTKYSGYSDENKTKISNIDSLGVPEMIDPIKHFDELASHAGFVDDSWKKGTSGLVDTGIPGNNRYVVNEQTAHKSGTNVTNLKALAKLFNQEVNDEATPLRQSLKYQNRDINKVLDQASSQLGIYTKTQTNDEHSVEKTNVDWDKGVSGIPPGSDVEFVSTGYNVKNATKYDTYTSGHERLKKLQEQVTKNGKLSTEDYIEYNQLKENHNKADSFVNNDKNYLKYKKDLDVAKKEYEYLSKLYNLKAYQQSYKTSDQQKGVAFVDNAYSKITDIQNKMSKIKNTYWNKDAVISSDYSLLPHTPEATKEYENLQKNIGGILKNASNINEFGDVVSFTDSKGVSRNITKDNNDNLLEQLNRMNPDKFTINRISGKGLSGRPELEIQFTPEVGSKSSDNDGSGFYDNTIGGEGNPVTIRLALKNPTNAKEGASGAFRSLSGAIGNYIGKQGTQGKILEDAFKNEYYKNFTYSELLNQGLAKGDQYAVEKAASIAASEGMNLTSFYQKYKNDNKKIVR